MAPIIKKAPDQISFGGNEIQLQLQSDAYIDSLPVKAVNQLTFKQEVPDGLAITLSYTGNQVTFTAKANPDGSGFQFPAGALSAAYVQSLVDWFAGNYFIGRDYLVTADTGGAQPALLFTSLATGNIFNFGGFDLDAISCSVKTPGSDGGLKSNFGFHTELWIERADGSAFDKAADWNIPLDEPQNGVSTLDISDSLNSFVTPDEPVMATMKQICANSVRRYYFKYGEIFGDDPAIQRVFQSAYYYIARGGLKLSDTLVRNIVSQLNPYPGDFTQSLFMRQGSKNIMVTPAQPEWLTWLNLTGAQQNILLEITLNNTDGSQLVITSVIAQVNPYQRVQYQTGYTQLNLANAQAAGKVISYYAVRVKAGNNYFTAAYNYVVDYRYWEWARYFVYENSLGAYQTLATVGKGQTEFDRAKDDAQRSVDQRTAALTGSYLECNILLQDKGTVAIGYERSNPRSNLLLRSFFGSEKKYLFQYGNLLPIGLTATNVKDQPDGENVYASSFEYIMLNQDKNYSEDPKLPDDPLFILIPGSGSDTVPPPDTAPIYDGIVDTGQNGPLYNKYFDKI